MNLLTLLYWDSDFHVSSMLGAPTSPGSLDQWLCHEHVLGHFGGAEGGLSIHKQVDMIQSLTQSNTLKQPFATLEFPPPKTTPIVFWFSSLHFFHVPTSRPLPQIWEQQVPWGMAKVKKARR